MISLLLFGATCLLAYSNGANDNFKGVASLFGSDTTNYQSALYWATLTTLLGSLASFLLAQGLLDAFSGKGLVPPTVVGEEFFLLSVAVGAGATVILATVLGFPISTTHSLVGAIAGAGWVAASGALNVSGLASTFVIPLLVSPFVAVGLAAALYWTFHHLRRSIPVEKRVDDDGETYAGHLLGVPWQAWVDRAHFLSAGIVSFARGLNDTPKIAALLLLVPFVEVAGGMVVVGLAMAVGGLLSARRVALTLGHRITGMNRGQGLAANLATGILVIWASRLGLPVSTTHVSVGSLFGIGLTTGQANLPVVRNVVLSWIVTLPCAGVFAGISYLVVPVLLGGR